MTDLPWEPDRPLGADLARSVVRAAFPAVDVSRFDLVGSGWEFDVFVTADRWAFRFPRRAEYQHRLEREQPVLELVRSQLLAEIAVPRVELPGAPSREFPYAFAGHRFIEGIPADAVPPALQPELARSIGAALSAIHGIPVSAARQAGVREMGRPDEGAYAWFRRNLDGATQLRDVDPTVREAVDWVSALAEPLQPSEAPTTLIHQDLSPEHLVVDPSTGRLVGILDWTAALLGDPARDFVAPATFGGWRFVEMILEHYRGTVDAGFRQRLRYVTRLLSVMWLGEARLTGGDVDKHIGWVERAFAPLPARTDVRPAPP